MSAAGVETRADRVGLGHAMHAEWIKLMSVRSTRWTLAVSFVVGAGLTIALCWVRADGLASPDAFERPASLITWGMVVAQFAAIILGSLAITNEYGNGMIGSTLTAVPVRGRVLAAKALVVTAVMFVVGTATALVGYVGANLAFERVGVGVPLEGVVARSMYGNGLFVAGLGVCTLAIGFVLRHTAATISVVLALMLVLGNLANLIPGAVGEWTVKLLPGNAGSVVASPIGPAPDLLDAWTGFGVFVLEIAVLLALAHVALTRRDT